MSINHSKRDDHVDIAKLATQCYNRPHKISSISNFLNFTITFIDLAREYNKTNDDETSPTEFPVM
jgi:hypothetical protein